MECVGKMDGEGSGGGGGGGAGCGRGGNFTVYFKKAVRTVYC